MLAIVGLCVQPASGLDTVTQNLLRLAGFFQDEEAVPVDELGWDSLPQEVNLRTEVEDLDVNFIQQGMRNSCAAFSATSMLELQLRRLGMNIDLSEQYVLWATTRFGADPSIGLTTTQLSRALVTHKICTEEMMPYKSGNEITEPTSEALAQAAAMPEIRMVDVMPQNAQVGLLPEDIFAICQRLAQYQPVSLSARWAEDGGSLSRDFVLQDTRTSIFHMVLVIGYELAPENPMDGYLLIRNSWGLRWGDFGYAKIPFSYLRKNGAEAIAFEFHWDEVSPEVKEVMDDSMVLAEKFPAFLSVHGGIAVMAFLVGLTVSGRVFGTSGHNAWGMARYALACAFLYLALARLSGVALEHGLEGFEKEFMLPLVGFLGVVVVIWRITMRSFELSAARTLGFLILMLAVWNGVFLGLSSVVPVKWYVDWRDATPGAVVEDYLALGMTDVENRAGFLRSVRIDEEGGEPSVDVHAERFDLWEASLLGDRSRMREDHLMAAKYYSRRLDAYRTQRAAYEGNGIGQESAAAPVDRQKVWQLYQELQAERETLDRANAAAVAAFNEKAAAYQKMKVQLERTTPTSPATEGGL